MSYTNLVSDSKSFMLTDGIVLSSRDWHCWKIHALQMASHQGRRATLDDHWIIVWLDHLDGQDESWRVRLHVNLDDDHDDDANCLLVQQLQSAFGVAASSRGFLEVLMPLCKIALKKFCFQLFRLAWDGALIWHKLCNLLSTQKLTAMNLSACIKRVFKFLITYFCVNCR